MPNFKMRTKKINWFGRSCNVACDGKCDKAWGINNRQQHMLSDHDEDDYEFLADDELGTAPERSPISEGDQNKPLPGQEMNKWCCRECERGKIFEQREVLADTALPNFDQRVQNIKRKDGQAEQVERAVLANQVVDGLKAVAELSGAAQSPEGAAAVLKAAKDAGMIFDFSKSETDDGAYVVHVFRPLTRLMVKLGEEE